MSSTKKQAVLTTLQSFIVLLALVLFSPVVRAQMSDFGGAALGVRAPERKSLSEAAG